jgi:hypothetical protein
MAVPRAASPMLPECPPVFEKGIMSALRGLALLVLLLASNANAQPEGSAALALHSYDTHFSAKQRETFEWMVTGIEEGLAWANADLKARNQAPLYCQPNVKFSTVQVIQILRQGIVGDAALAASPLGMAVLVSLKKTFPCR